MQENLLFEYAVIRIMPKVEREEFLNVGVILYAHKKKQLVMRYKLDESRLLALQPDMDVNEVAQHLQAFERICNGAVGSGPIGRLDAAARFRWLTATSSTIVQTSKVHPGLCLETGKALDRLYDQYVG